MNESTGEGATFDPNAPAIETRRLSKRYPRTWALRAVDLRIERGARVCLLGPNGSGKSTLLRIVAGAARPTRGEVRIFGSERRKAERAVRTIGFLSHQSYLYSELTAVENLRFAATMYGVNGTEDRLHRALEIVGLSHVSNEQVRTYSSGMTKRLALARATLHDPEIVLLDEPYGALDIAAIEWLESFIAGLRATNRTILVATHEAGRALRWADRAILLRNGRVEYDGPASSYAATVGLEAE